MRADLIDAGIFSSLATACQPGAHRVVSHALVAISLGAVESPRRGIATSVLEPCQPVAPTWRMHAAIELVDSSADHGAPMESPEEPGASGAAPAAPEADPSLVI